MGGAPSKDTLQMQSREWDGAGKVAIVTGPMGTGIGFHTARWLAERGCYVVLAGRSAERLRDCARLIREAAKGPQGQQLEAENVHLSELVLDLGSLQSVEEFARSFQALNLPLHILINNAGIMNTSYGMTVDGFEQQMGTNHLGHFHLTRLLMPQLHAGAPSRVVCVASMGHKLATMTSDNLTEVFHPTSKQYSGWRAYGNSKLANILMARSLQAKHADNGVTAYSLHPGVVATELGRQNALGKFFYSWGAFAMKTAAEGAGTSIYCATHPSAALHGGGFFDVCDYSKNTSAKAIDDALAEALWVRSEEEIAAWQAKRANNPEGGAEAVAQAAAASAAEPTPK